jgi:serine/threonine protein phosphatase PrpC
MSKVTTASLTDVGRVRAHNEDSCGEFDNNAGYRLLVVADGMGGHRGGATASRVAIETIGEVFKTSKADPETMLQDALHTANDRVHRMAVETPELRGMGTTAVTLLLGPEGTGWVAHVGDSRAYRMRRGLMQPLSADHSVVAEMQRRGLITAEEAAVHPRRNEILRSVGVQPSVEPEVTRLTLEPGDRFLLCSDGLSGMLEDPEMGELLANQAPEQAARTLVDTANMRGGPDNITVQIAIIPGGDTTMAGLAPQSDILKRIPTDSSSRVRTIAAITAIGAGILALALLWFAFSGPSSS